MSNSWIDQMSQQMEHHEVEAPQGLWEGIERELEARSRVRRARVAWMWRAGVAAAVVGIALGVLMLENVGTDDTVRIAQTDAAKLTLLRTEKTADAPSESLLTTLAEAVHTQPSADGPAPVAHIDGELAECAEAPTEPQDDAPLLAETTAEQGEASNAPSEAEDDVYRVTTQPAREALLPVPNVHHKAHRVSMQLLAVAAGVPSMSASSGWDIEAVSPFYGVRTDSVMFESQRRANVVGPNRVQRYAYTTPNYDSHDFPVKVGVTVRVPLGRRVAIDGGLSYTRMRSAVNFLTPDYLHYVYGTQFVNYLGVPLSLVVDLWNSGRWAVYASGGGEAAKSVKSTWRTNIGSEYSAPASPWQFSLSAAVGAQFNVTERVGIYAQPSADYYFDNHSVVRTYYSEHPFTPALRVGVRINL